MSTEEIICSNLDFLVKNYGFIFKSNTNGKQTWCYLSNDHGSVNWYSWDQFGEYELSLDIYGREKVILDSFRQLSYTPLHIKRINLITRIFRDSRKVYWQRIAIAFKNQINETGTLFGLKLDLKNSFTNN